MFEEVRLVWNLTLKCRYHCSHCAASARTTFQDNADLKLRILRAIIDSKLPVRIDFSGGDPWCGEGSLEVMQLASATYGRENISISGLGLSVLAHSSPPPLLKSLAGSYDLTYDRPWWYHDPLRKGYNLTNLMALNMLNRMGIEHNVMLPVWEMSQSYCEHLVKSLLPTNPSSVLLLRLMPVGRNQQSIPNDHLIADRLIDVFRTFGYSGKVKKNCALQERCNGLSNTKLGLDHLGNLFWCIWAADLPVKKEVNPFYLGNLLEEPLQEILAHNRVRSIQIPRNCCHVLDFHAATIG